MTEAGVAIILDVSDEILAARVGEDQDAFPELYRRYLDPVYRFMRYQAPTDEAQDLTAMVFFNAFSSARQFRAEGTYRAWLFRIARNTLSTWRRGRDRGPVPMPEVPDVHDDASDPGLAVAEAQASRDLWAAVSELSPTDRELIELRYVEGMAHGEIADATGISAGAIRVRIHRLLRRLRSSLEKLEVRS